MTSRSTKRIAALICSLGLTLCVGLFVSSSWASPEATDPFAGYAESPPVVSSAEDLGDADPAGYYRLEVDGRAHTVYWMPKGTADEAPPEIKETPAWQSSVRVGSTEAANEIIDAPGSGLVMGASGIGRCPNTWACLFKHGDFNGVMRKWHDPGYWQSLAPWPPIDGEASSLANKKNKDVMLAETTGGGGATSCWDDDTNYPHLGTYNWTDRARSIKIRGGNSAC